MVGTSARHRGVSFIIGTRDHPPRVDRHDYSGAAKPCQRRPGVPGNREGKEVAHAGRRALLSRPLGGHTPTRRPRCTTCRRTLLCLTDLSRSPLNAVGGTLPWHHRHGETTDAVWDIQCSGALPIRRAPVLPAEGENIIQTDPPRLWRVCQGSATCVEVACRWDAHREYTRNREGWQENCTARQGPWPWGDEEAAETVPEERQ
jgi:hypothetical protein